MRRNRRKLAAQLLDQQLSQAVDETLTEANYAPPPRSCLFPTSQDPVSALPQPAYFHSMPRELPLPIFSKFDLAAFSHLTVPSTTPPPLRTPTPFRTLPKWCPRIPSLTLGDVWRDSLPTFHDLSSLPEPAEPSSAPSGATRTPCKDLQVWCPIGVGYGRDQSRFFPPRSRSSSEKLGNARGRGVTVRLPPPLACRLHRSDNSVGSSSATPISQHSISQAISAAFTEMNTTGSLPDRRSEQSQCSKLIEACCENEKSKPSPTLPISPCDTLDNTASNTLEQVLEASQTSATAFNQLTPCPNEIVQTTIEAKESHHPNVRCLPQYNDAQPPYELDGRATEIPYVHANSLTGYSNDPDVLDTLPAYEERRDLANSGIGLPIIISSETRDMVGLNELVVDHDIMTPAYALSATNVPLPVSLPATPPATPPLHPLGDMATVRPVDCIPEAEHTHSDAHYCSEQALFSSPASLAQSTDTMHAAVYSSSINIADFLKLGHAKQCWCGHCAGESYDSTNASISSSVTLADQDLAADGDGDLTISLLLHPSESEPDTASDDPELLDCSETTNSLTRNIDDNVATVEDDDWLLFSPATVEPADEPTPSAPTMYLPSSPILHRQRQQRAPAPTVIITSSEQSANEPSDDYIAVAAPTSATTSPTATKMAWHDMFPRRSSSMWKPNPAICEGESFGLGFASARRGSWRWGRESEEEWWDWAVEEEC